MALAACQGRIARPGYDLEDTHHSLSEALHFARLIDCLPRHWGVVCAATAPRYAIRGTEEEADGSGRVSTTNAVEGQLRV